MSTSNDWYDLTKIYQQQVRHGRKSSEFFKGSSSAFHRALGFKQNADETLAADAYMPEIRRKRENIRKLPWSNRTKLFRPRYKTFPPDFVTMHAGDRSLPFTIPALFFVAFGWMPANHWHGRRVLEYSGNRSSG